MFRRISAATAAAAVVLSGLILAAAPANAIETISVSPSSYSNSADQLEVTINGFPAMASGRFYVYWLDFTNMTGSNSGTTCPTFSGSTGATPNGSSEAGFTDPCLWVTGTKFRFVYSGATGLGSSSQVTITFPGSTFGLPADGEYGVNFTAGGTQQFQLDTVCLGNCPVGYEAPPPAQLVTIDIDPNGGSCGTSKVTGFYSTWSNAPGDCTKPGAIFLGFNTNAGASDASIAPGGNLHLTGDNRIYAIYETPRVSDAPTDVAAVAGKNQVTVSWKAPVDPGSGDISNYLAQATPSGRVCITSAGSPDPLSCTFNLPATNTQYSFKVQALNIAGWGTESAASNAVSPYDVVLLTAERPKAGFFQRLAGWGSTISTTGRAPGIAPGTAVTPQWKAGDGEWISESRDGVKVGSDNQISWSKKIRRNLNRDPISVRFAVVDVTSEEYVLRIGTTVGVPVAPRDVKTSFIEARVPAQRRLQVSWTPPADDGGARITSYEVSAQLLDNSAPVRCRVNADQPLTCILPIGALDRRKTYTVKVTAINARGTGQPGSANFRRPA